MSYFRYSDFYNVFALYSLTPHGIAEDLNRLDSLLYKNIYLFSKDYQIIRRVKKSIKVIRSESTRHRITRISRKIEWPDLNENECNSCIIADLRDEGDYVWKSVTIASFRERIKTVIVMVNQTDFNKLLKHNYICSSCDKRISITSKYK